MPDSAAQAHSVKVQEAIKQQISAVGPIPFSTFLQLVLHEPGLGYYATGSQKLGEGGDFVTAPELSPLFGQCLAVQCQEALTETGGDILEIGAGSGQLALSILTSLGASGVEFAGHYLILETSADLAQRQQQLLADSLAPSVMDRCRWLTGLPSEFTGVVLANEVIDAMPIERFVIAADGVKQWFVAQKDNELLVALQPASPEVLEAVKHLQADLPAPLPVGYCSEVNLLLQPWVRGLSDSMIRGLCLLIDYGYPRTEYYLPDRMSGTLRCYFQHRTHDNPFWYPGAQDITCDVDFTALAEAADAAGLALHGYTSQGQFLLGNGLAEQGKLSADASDGERFALARDIQTLTMASGMGERFQVMGLSRDLDASLSGFSGFDQSHRL
ncbi:MAG: SAM-dependent methyltransferase [Granulosicoccus sp.]|nr:SAM-dependent methyltransferase [Granulosicoccus sp.]